MAEKDKTTTERKCIECNSENVKYQGASHSIGVGERMAEPYKHQFKCENCGEIFWYKGERP